MREIKFRAWNKSAQVMTALSRLTELPVETEGKFTILMQYTGLKDKNGKDIYESDVIGDHISVGVVKHSDHNAAFRVVYSDGRAKWFADYNLKGERESIEVIGNIYQHRELIK